MIPDYQSMSLANLIDLLASQTSKYTQMLAEKEFTEEYAQVKERIQQLQAIIEVRKGSSVQTGAGPTSVGSNP